MIAAPLPGEPIIFKIVNSAFIGTFLEQQLRDRDIRCLVITGLTTDHCVSATTRMAANLGFKVYCVSDGPATFDCLGPRGKRYTADEVHNVSLASLSGEFATIVNTERSRCNTRIVAGVAVTMYARKEYAPTVGRA